MILSSLKMPNPLMAAYGTLSKNIEVSLTHPLPIDGGGRGRG